MEVKLFWIAIIALGSTLGAFLRLAVAGRAILILLAVAIIVAVSAALLELIPQEALLIVMGVGPIAIVMFAAAALSNALRWVVRRFRSPSE